MAVQNTGMISNGINQFNRIMPVTVNSTLEYGDGYPARHFGYRWPVKFHASAHQNADFRKLEQTTGGSAAECRDCQRFSPEAWIWRQVRHWHGCRTRSPEKGWITAQLPWPDFPTRLPEFLLAKWRTDGFEGKNNGFNMFRLWSRENHAIGRCGCRCSRKSNLEMEKTWTIPYW